MTNDQSPNSQLDPLVILRPFVSEYINAKREFNILAHFPGNENITEELTENLKIAEGQLIQKVVEIVGAV
jgi:hypothetical protein